MARNRFNDRLGSKDQNKRRSKLESNDRRVNLIVVAIEQYLLLADLDHQVRFRPSSARRVPSLALEGQIDRLNLKQKASLNCRKRLGKVSGRTLQGYNVAGLQGQADSRLLALNADKNPVEAFHDEPGNLNEQVNASAESRDRDDRCQ